jgi:hypothetical protein
VRIISRDIQCRKWLLTINNPDEHKFSESEIENILNTFKFRYACLSREIGENGTPHIHLFIYAKSRIRFSTIKKRFPTAHIDKAYGSVVDNIAYITKTGKWENTDKAETSVEGSFKEYGEAPSALEEHSPELSQILDDIVSGMSTSEIITEYPQHIFRVNAIDTVRQTFLADKYRERMRSVCVTYIHGASGVGKTRGIYKHFPAESICRITSYSKNGVKFDSYCGQEVLVFEEFASQIPIEEMLNYLDVYPLMLPARYTDKVACYTKVIITSNLPLNKQYVNEQIEKQKTYNAFLRRINYVIEYDKKGHVKKKTLHKEVSLDEKNT